MIKGKDIIDENLFDKQVKDVIKLAVALEDLEKGLKNVIVENKELGSNKDIFKSYDGYKKAVTGIEKLELATTSLVDVEKEHVYHGGNLSQRLLVGGYCNVIVAIDGVQFAMSSGNIDAGTIKLYGIKDS